MPVMLLISIKHGFVFLADLQRHLTLTEETSKVRIVIFQPDTCTVFDVLIVVVRITGAAGAKERHIPTRNSRKQIADFQNNDYEKWRKDYELVRSNLNLHFL